MSDFTVAQLELLWEAVQYQIGSLEYIARRDPLWKLAPPGIAKYEADFRDRIDQLKQLASEIEARLINLEGKP